MDALRSRQRSRIAPLTEWLLAAGFLFAALTVGAVIVRELRTGPVAPRVAPVARALPPSASPWVPSRAVSVPMLPFQDGKEIRVGDNLAAVATTLGRSAEMGRQEVDLGAHGERLTRFYEYAGARFILVFEPIEKDGDHRLAAIYLP